MECKIVGCHNPAYRARMCRACYQSWLMTGVLPKRVVMKEALPLETLLEEEAHRTMLARTNGQKHKERADRLERECRELRAQLSDQRAIVAAANSLAQAAADLPDVVKSNSLRRALSEWRRVRKCSEKEKA